MSLITLIANDYDLIKGWILNGGMPKPYFTESKDTISTQCVCVCVCGRCCVSHILLAFVVTFNSLNVI